MNKQVIVDRLRRDGVVVTHFGDDLDNVASIEALRQETGLELRVERVPAGQFKPGRVNIDTGGHRGSWQRGDTLVIDGDSQGIRSTVMQLSLLGFDIPAPLVKLADVKVVDRKLLDPRYGLNLVRHLAPGMLFRFAEEGLLEKSLTDQELEKYNLVEAYRSQRETILQGLDEVERFRFGDVVVAEKYIPMGSAIAYALGCSFYASISPHKKGGVTFAITSRPDRTLPGRVLRWGRRLSREYRIDENSSFVYVSRDNTMVIAGGAKNPDFSIPWTVSETSKKIKKLFNISEEET